MKKSYIFLGIFLIILITIFIIFLSYQKEVIEGKSSMDDDNIIIGNQSISLVCDIDIDCIIVDKEMSYRSCWPGACAQVDYSLDNYIGVNKESYEKYKESELKFRPSVEKCGLMPGCPISLINMNFDAKCVNERCKKIPK